MAARLLADAELLCALDRPPWLVVESGDERRPLSGAVREGPAPRLPRRGPGGHVAYLQLTSRPASPEWSCALALLDAGGAPLDLLPGAFVHAAPAFAPGGDSLLYVRDVDGEAREVVVLDLAGGDDRVVATGNAIRSVAWASRTAAVVSTTDGIERIALDGPGPERIVDDSVATGFQRFGLDDLYVTIDGLVRSATGTLAWMRTWHQHGRAARSDVVVQRPGAAPRTWRDLAEPRFVGPDGLVARSAGGGLVAPATGERREVPGLCGFDAWLAEEPA